MTYLDRHPRLVWCVEVVVFAGRLLFATVLIAANRRPGGLDRLGAAIRGTVMKVHESDIGWGWSLYYAFMKAG